MWCLNRHLNPRKVHPERITESDKESAKKLDFSGITFPVTIIDIKRIEKQNKININLFGYDIVKKIYFIQFQISEERYDDHLDLLYIEGKK